MLHTCKMVYIISNHPRGSQLSLLSCPHRGMEQTRFRRALLRHSPHCGAHHPIVAMRAVMRSISQTSRELRNSTA